MKIFVPVAGVDVSKRFSDLCPLLMNLLENALEANEKAPEGADK